MKIPEQVPSSLHSAFEIYLEEFKTHSQSLEKIISDCQGLKAEELKAKLLESAGKLNDIFHVLKGGAAFMNLQTIRNCSDSCENIFKNDDAIHSDAEAVLSKLEESYQKLLEEFEAFE